ncbi:MAG TPA: glycosyltransferase [Thermoanaerobaculia bacterium]|jgi:glycosyltransferase involved in cell wall biosynthesis
MRIAQIVLPTASEFERKCQRVDFAALSPKHEVTAGHATPVDVTHVYGPPSYVGDSIVSALECGGLPPLSRYLPEAVEEMYFDVHSPDRQPHRVGSFARPSLRNIVDQTLVRIARFRNDVQWTLFDHPPSPANLAGVDAWVDPAVAEDDFDGFVAEAIAAGKAVVASRTAINSQRLEHGRTGLLVPCNDPNELAHAILAALFKPEVARSKIEAAQQTAGKFRPRQRLRVLERIYEAAK